MKKSYSDIERQVNRIIVNYLVNDYSQPHSERHAAIVLKVRAIQRRYTLNINRAEGFHTMSAEEAEAANYGAMYYVYKSASKRYQRQTYAGY